MSKIRFTNTTVVDTPPADKLFVFMEDWILKQKDENWVVTPVVNSNDFYTKNEIDGKIDVDQAYDYATYFDNIYLN